MSLYALLFFSFGVVTSVRVGLTPAGLRACGGRCTNEQYLVCAAIINDVYVFPNHCYMDVANKCRNITYGYQKFLERHPGNCQYFVDYDYFEFPSCVEVARTANEERWKNTFEFNTIVRDVISLFKRNENKLKYDYPKLWHVMWQAINQFDKYASGITDYGENDQITWSTKCANCTEYTSDMFEQCLRTELDAFKTELEEVWKKFKKIEANITNVDKVDQRDLINDVIDLEDAILWRRVKDYFEKQLYIYHKAYLRVKRESQNYNFSSAVLSIGRVLIYSFKMAVATFNTSCGLESELRKLIYATEEITKPFDASNYPLPSLSEFTSAYGGIREDGIYANIWSYEQVFLKAQIYIESINVTGNIGAYYRYSKIITSLYDLLNSTSCDIKEVRIYSLLSCLSDVKSVSINSTYFVGNVTKCYDVYSMQNYCLNSIYQLPANIRLTELVSCISLALKFIDKNFINCCFK